MRARYGRKKTAAQLEAEQFDANILTGFTVTGSFSAIPVPVPVLVGEIECLWPGFYAVIYSSSFVIGWLRIMTVDNTKCQD